MTSDLAVVSQILECKAKKKKKKKIFKTKKITLISLVHSKFYFDIYINKSYYKANDNPVG